MHLWEWLKVKRLAKPSVCENMEELELLYNAQRNGKLYDHLEDSLAISWKVKNTLSYDPIIPVLGICPRELKAYVHTTLVPACSKHLYL